LVEKNMSNSEYDKLSLPYDPDLKEAMLKIQAILEEYKIGGSICLSSKTHSEFLYHFPKWCIVQLDKVTPEGQMIRVEIRKKNIEEALQNEHNIMRSSVHLIARGRDMAGSSFEVFSDIFEKLEEYMDIQHAQSEEDKKFIPHLVN